MTHGYVYQRLKYQINYYLHWSSTQFLVDLNIPKVNTKNLKYYPNSLIVYVIVKYYKN